jgi:hypothetical protein
VRHVGRPAKNVIGDCPIIVAIIDHTAAFVDLVVKLRTPECQHVGRH